MTKGSDFAELIKDEVTLACKLKVFTADKSLYGLKTIEISVKMNNPGEKTEVFTMQVDLKPCVTSLSIEGLENKYEYTVNDA